jgi:hypothetical protein
MKRSGSFLAVLVLFFASYSADAATRGLRCDFSQDHRTYSWNFRFDYARDTTQALYWRLTSLVNSTLTKRSDGPDWSQDDGDIGLSLTYRVSRGLKAGAVFSQNLYSSEETRAATSDYGVSSEVDFAGVNFIQILGVKSVNNRDGTSKLTERSERGFNLNQTISLSPAVLSGSVTRLSLNQSLVQLKRAPVRQRDFRLSFLKYLSDPAPASLQRDSIKVAYREAWTKKKFFSGRSQKVNRRDIDLRAAKQVPLGLRLDFAVNYLYDRDRRYSTADDTLDFYLLSSSLNADLRLEKELLAGVLAGAFYKFIRSHWDYLDEARDQEMESGELGGEVKARITSADSLCLTASVGVTSFFAPLSGQFNDRDRLTVLAWGEYLHVFSTYLDARVEGGFRNFHQVYMSELASFDNNHDQTYVLSPSLSWRPADKLSLKQEYRIKANYRYYDYEKSEETSRNSLFRRASSTSAITYRYSPRMTFFVRYTYKYEDDGPLIWTDQWVQKISRDQRTNTINLSLEYRPFGKVSLSPAYTYEKRKSWSHEAVEVAGPDQEEVKEKRVLTDTFFRNMISFSVRYFADQDNHLHLSAAHRLQDGSHSRRESSDYVTVSISRTF